MSNFLLGPVRTYLDTMREGLAIAALNGVGSQAFVQASRDNSEALQNLLTARIEADVYEEMRPRVVCLCGSTRFRKAYEKANRLETLAGRVVLSVGLLGHAVGLDMAGPVKAGLDALHLWKVRMADEVLILDDWRPYCAACNLWWEPPPGPEGIDPYYWVPSCYCNGQGENRPYIGESTRNELTLAEQLGKVVRYLSKERKAFDAVP
jgi:hypothetical protein